MLPVPIVIGIAKNTAPRSASWRNSNSLNRRTVSCYSIAKNQSVPFREFILANIFCLNIEPLPSTNYFLTWPACLLASCKWQFMVSFWKKVQNRVMSAICKSSYAHKPVPLPFIRTRQMLQHLTSFRIFISGRIASVSSLFVIWIL